MPEAAVGLVGRDCSSVGGRRHGCPKQCVVSAVHLVSPVSSGPLHHQRGGCNLGRVELADALILVHDSATQALPFVSLRRGQLCANRC